MESTLGAPNLSGFLSGLVCSLAAVLVVHKLMFARSMETDPEPSAPDAPATLDGLEQQEHAEGGASPELEQTELKASDTVIMVTYMLPVKVERAAGGGFNVQWDSERRMTVDGLKLPTKLFWVGCIRLQVTKEEEDELEKLLLAKFHCVVVFLEPEMQYNFYNGFCKGYLQPIFHNQMPVPSDKDPFKEEEWRAYCHVNRIFATKVLEVYEPGYMTWVHDYHLMLLPSCMIRKMQCARKIEHCLAA